MRQPRETDVDSRDLLTITREYGQLSTSPDGCYASMAAVGREGAGAAEPARAQQPARC